MGYQQATLNQIMRACAQVQGARGEAILAFLDAWNWKGAPEEGELQEFCDAAETWRHTCSDPDQQYDYYRVIHLEIGKSNLLFRVLECGEAIRKHPCPKHQGRWSGLDFGPNWFEQDMHCALCGKTGWLIGEKPETLVLIEHYQKSTFPLFQQAAESLLNLCCRGVPLPALTHTERGLDATWTLATTQKQVVVHFTGEHAFLVCKTSTSPLATEETSLSVLASILLEKQIQGSTSGTSETPSNPVS